MTAAVPDLPDPSALAYAGAFLQQIHALIEAGFDEETADRLAREGVGAAFLQGQELAEQQDAHTERVRERMLQEDALERARLREQLSLSRQVEVLRTRRAAQRLVDAEERPPVEFPAPTTLRELLAAPPDPVAWRIEGWWPAGGRVVFAAAAKSGKTTSVVNLTRSLVDGALWLGRDAVTPLKGKVALLDFEMTERQLVEWYRRAGIVNADQVVVLPLRGKGASFDLVDEETRTRWVELLKAHDVELVILDCLGPVLRALGLDENHEAGTFLAAFDALLAELGGAEALVVHHTGHEGERARGDSYIIGWGDANWLVTRDKLSPEERFISANGRDVDQREAQVQLDRETGALTLVGGSRRDARFRTAMDAIEQWLTEAEEPLTGRAIEALAIAEGLPRTDVREGLKTLIALRQVLTEQGERRSILHRWNPECASAPERAERTGADQCASAPPPYRAAHSHTRHQGSEGEDQDQEVGALKSTPGEQAEKA